MTDMTATAAPIAETDYTAPPGSEQEMAEYLVGAMNGNLRYVAASGKWMVYRNGVWLAENTLMAWDLAKYASRRYAVKVSDAAAKTVTSNKTINAVVNLARSDRRIVAEIDQWDRDDLLLNTPAGVVDLTTGNLREARPNDYMTKQTSVAPGADCPLWRKFIDEVTMRDKELAAYLQRFAGYALTGLVIEQSLDFLYGGGGNGKSVFLRLLGEIMGNYAITAPAALFVESKNERHTTELARLHSARLVIANETESNHYWSEARIKTMTGGDTIVARFMHQNDFEFRPKFKIIIAGNHKPNLRNITPAIRRRFHIVPFNLELGRDRQDPHLEERLKLELPGILAWAIQGCVAWQLGGGLNPPASVIDETEEYLQRQDTFGEWFEEYCVVDRAAWTSTADLYARYKIAMQANGEAAKHSRAFSEELERYGRGFGITRRKGEGRGRGRGFGGVKLNGPTVPEGEKKSPDQIPF